jgi:hypothetical protein
MCSVSLDSIDAHYVNDHWFYLYVKRGAISVGVKHYLMQPEELALMLLEVDPLLVDRYKISTED